MIIKNRLDKVFGPFGSSTGFFLFLGGIITSFYSLFGLIIVLVGAFVSFTSTSSFVDSDNKRMKFSNNLFGIFPVGKWIDIKPGMKLGLKKSHQGYLAYSWANQSSGIHINDIRIFLYGTDNKKIMPVKKFDSYQASKNEIKELSIILGLEII